jgi:putative sigma-54 modulation protein
MRIVVTGRHVAITPELRRLVDRRLAKVDRVLGDAAVSGQIVLTQEKYRRVTELTLHARGDHIMHGVAEAATWAASLAAAVDKLLQQALRLKGRWGDRKRRAASRLAGGPAAPRIAAVRRARYRVRSMSIEEAAAAMDGAGGFVVFRNNLTDVINVVFRRKNGELGLIEPEA